MRYLLLLGVLISGPLFADRSDDVIQSNDMNNLTGDLNVEGSSAVGFGRSSFDVDINQCMGSTSWDTIIVGKQKLVLNKWCAAEAYDARGLHNVAARLRCQIPEIADLFGPDEDCVLENTLLGPPGGIAGTIPTPGPDEDGYRPDEAGEVSKGGGPPAPGVELVQRELQMHAEEYESLEQRIARMERGNAAAAAKRRDYAQQTMEKLRDNDPEE
jgi:hypothetical protein